MGTTRSGSISYSPAAICTLSMVASGMSRLSSRSNAKSILLRAFHQSSRFDGILTAFDQDVQLRRGCGSCQMQTAIDSETAAFARTYAQLQHVLRGDTVATPIYLFVPHPLIYTLPELLKGSRKVQWKRRTKRVNRIYGNSGNARVGTLALAAVYAGSLNLLR